MMERRAELEARIEDLATSVARLELRIASLERSDHGSIPAAEPEPEDLCFQSRQPQEASSEAAPDSPSSAATVLGLGGRVCLVLAGAFFIRFLTESRVLPPGGGVSIGLAYAAVWILVADRFLKSNPLGALFFALGAASIGYPLIWEATARFRMIQPALAALLLILFTSLLVGVAWRGRMKGLAWIATVGGLLSALTLMAATGAVQSFTAALLAMGLMGLVQSYAGRLEGLRWPTALAADGAVLILATLASWPGGPPEVYRGLSSTWALTMALMLVMGYLGVFAFENLRKKRQADTFEVVQTLIALSIGLGMALRVAHAAHLDLLPLGLAALMLGLACYGVAFSFVEHAVETGKNFLFYTSLGCALVLFAVPILARGSSVAYVQLGAGLGLALLGRKFGRITLHAHGALFLTAAALALGLPTATTTAFLGLPESMPLRPPLALIPLAVCATTAHALLAGGLPRNWPRRLPSFWAALIACIAWACLLVHTGSLLAGWEWDAAGLAALRSLVLAAASLCLAALSRPFPASEIRWLVYPLLGIGGLKLLVEDLPNGRALTLFVALAAFGLSMMISPRLLRPRPSVPPGSP